MYSAFKKVKSIKKELYFYHLINKSADITDGIFSLQYMYDNKMYDLFDNYVEKYKERITNTWNIEKYKGQKSLTREEYLDALKIFRGKYGTSYIYFFKYPPYKELGKRMEDILKHKDIYRININNNEVKNSIEDIFYGHDMSHSDNKILDRKYYENVSKEEYFSNYDDSIEMNFSKLNHIGIAFKKDRCKREFLEEYKNN